MVNAVLTVGVVLLAGLALWWAVRVEPHWASRDGQRFVARVHMLRSGDQPEGRWREVRAGVTTNRTVLLRPRGLAAGAVRGEWRMVNASVDERRRRAVYVAVRVQGDDRLVLRIPLSSRSRPVLDALVGATSDGATSAN
jgi:hypothetical protein